MQAHTKIHFYLCMIVKVTDKKNKTVCHFLCLSILHIFLIFLSKVRLVGSVLTAVSTQYVCAFDIAISILSRMVLDNTEGEA
jgi:hypothetical protein